MVDVLILEAGNVRQMLQVSRQGITREVERFETHHQLHTGCESISLIYEWILENPVGVLENAV